MVVEAIKIKLDIGCGENKQERYIGLDIVKLTIKKGNIIMVVGEKAKNFAEGK